MKFLLGLTIGATIGYAYIILMSAERGKRLKAELIGEADPRDPLGARPAKSD